MSGSKFEILITAETEDGVDRVVLVDGTLRELHSETSQATEFPVGSVKTLSDHIQTLPSLLSVDLYVTETPLRALNPALVSDYEITERTTRHGSQEATSLGPSRRLAPFERAIALYDALDQVRREGRFLTVTSALRRYSRMVITRIEAPVEGPRQEVIISVDFKSIALANSQVTTEILVEEPRLQRSEDRGNQPGDEETDESEPIPQSMLQSISSLFG